MNSKPIFAGILFAVALTVAAQQYEVKPDDPFFAKYQPIKAPAPSGLLLKEGDQLAICGDSITEQKMYSRIIETYLTVCVPELKITVRQYGWSGERADGFLARMTNDVLRFHPTIATTCYGMNDHEYRTYEKAIGDKYRQFSTGIIQAFKANNVRAIQGSPGCIGKRPPWSKDRFATAEDMNFSLCQLRNIGLEIAQSEKVPFADVFWPMLLADYDAWRSFGQGYALAGNDGVHPNWAGHTVMAYAFLRSLGLDGEVGTIIVDLGRNKATASTGHEVVSCKNDEVTLKSAKYPFCAAGAENKDDSIRSGMKLVHFNDQLNRLTLVAKHAKKARNYKVTWGSTSKTYSGDQLLAGINLADDLQVNPFSEAFAKVDEAVARKQAYETKQIKELFRSADAKSDMDGTVARTEKERAALVDAVKAAFVPVTHTIKISAE